MNLRFAYQGRSAVQPTPNGLAVSLAPNLRRDRVSYLGVLKQPLRFREAISTLHDVVLSDLRFKPRDKSAYQAYLEEQKTKEQAIRQAAYQETKKAIQANRTEPLPPGLEAEYHRSRKLYWNARQQYSNYIARHDPDLWRLLMPCDPVITVAPDILFFECFSADESSYGCLGVSREAFTGEENVSQGTTNVDYSWSLYEHFQKLRSYRETRFVIDPAGFEVRTTESADYREEKIDLPPSWLQGFLQLQSAMSLPMRRVPISREGLYNVLAWLMRHRSAKSPRAIRFELRPGQPIQLVLEPWNREIVLHDQPYLGERSETIRVWGRDRLRVLARLLPLVERMDVYLLGSGLPSFWVARMGDMDLTLGLSGWTTNDWARGSALDQIAPPAKVGDQDLRTIGLAFHESPHWSFAKLQEQTRIDPPKLAAGLNQMALLGQVIQDLPNGVYRWRQVMPVEISVEQIGPENPETKEGRTILERRLVNLQRQETTPTGLNLLVGKAADRPVELLLDGDGRIVRARCTCSHHYQFGLKKGPCRHLQALRNFVHGTDRPANLDRWYQRLWN